MKPLILKTDRANMNHPMMDAVLAAIDGIDKKDGVIIGLKFERESQLTTLRAKVVEMQGEAAKNATADKEDSLGRNHWHGKESAYRDVIDLIDEKEDES